MATVPSVTTQTVGGSAGAAWANSVKAGIDFHTGSGANVRPLAVLRQTVAQNILTNTWTSITFDAEDLDTDGGHSTVTNTSRYTAVTAGWFQCFGHVSISADAAGPRRYLGFRKNGSGTDLPTHGYVSVAATSESVGLTCSAMIYLSVGDWVQIVVLQDSGSTLSTIVTTEGQPYLHVAWQTS